MQEDRMQYQMFKFLEGFLSCCEFWILDESHQGPRHPFILVLSFSLPFILRQRHAPIFSLLFKCTAI